MPLYLYLSSDCLLTSSASTPKYWHSFQYIPNQWIVFFTHSNWLLDLGIVRDIHLPARESPKQNGFLVFYRNRSRAVYEADCLY